MDDVRFGQVLRRLRTRRRLSQRQVAMLAGASQSTVSRLERGHLGGLRVDTLRAIAVVLEVRVELVVRWRGGDLDRLVNARHSALHDRIARGLAALPDWRFEPEVSFSIWGERGVVDILAWQARGRTLLVIE